jgi:FXSXX-COOH protein
LVEQLDALAVRFEADHPALGAAIRQVVDALAKAGI